jgi:hypothetical protein
MQISSRENRRRMDEAANVAPDRARSVLNTIGENEFEIVGFMKPETPKTTSGTLPCEQPDTKPAAPPKPAATKKIVLEETASTKASKQFKEAAAKAKETAGPQPASSFESKEDAEYRQKIGGFVDSRDVWSRMSKSRDKVIEELSSAGQQPITELEMVRLEKLLKDEDKYHWRMGQIGFDDEERRNDYYALHVIALQLNKARWQNIDLSSQKGQQTTGSNVRSMFWKESLNGIIDKGRMVEGQFVDSHPTLRPFAEAVKRRRLTKTFLRGFVDSRLKVMAQPPT